MSTAAVAAAAAGGGVLLLAVGACMCAFQRRRVNEKRFSIELKHGLNEELGPQQELVPMPSAGANDFL